jgi:hypothetical protein
VIKRRRLKWAGYLVPIGEKRQVQTMFIRRDHVNRKLGRLRSRWEGNININIGRLDLRS